MEYTTANPFIPKASVVRYPNSIFEARIHLPGAAAHIDVVPHQNFILVTGSLSPRVRIDSDGKPSTLVFTDQPCGVFGRDIPVNLSPGTELVVISAHQDCDDYIIRYTIRNSISPRPNCADYANATAAGVSSAAAAAAAAAPTSAPCKCPPGMKGSCGGAGPLGAGPGIYVGPAFVRPAPSYAVPPALIGRGPGHSTYGYGAYHAHHPGCTPHHYYAHGGVPHPGYMPYNIVFHPNGGATF